MTSEKKKTILESQPSVKPVDTKPVDIKPVEVKQVDVKSVDVKPVDDLQPKPKRKYTRRLKANENIEDKIIIPNTPVAKSGETLFLKVDSEPVKRALKSKTVPYIHSESLGVQIDTKKQETEEKIKADTEAKLKVAKLNEDKSKRDAERARREAIIKRYT